MRSDTMPDMKDLPNYLIAATCWVVFVTALIYALTGSWFLGVGLGALIVGVFAVMLNRERNGH